MTDIVKLIYSLIIGVSVAIVAGMSIAALNPAPQFPSPTNFSVEPSEEQMKKDEASYKEYDKKFAQHSSDTSKIALAASVVIFLIGLAAAKKTRLNEVIADGLLLGGLFTAVYAAARSTGTMLIPYGGADMERWVSVVAAITALVMALIIAQIKFSPAQLKKKSSK